MPHQNTINWIDWVPYVVKLANTSYTGIGTPNWVIRPLDRAVFIQELTFQAGDGDNVQTVARIFLNNGGEHTDPDTNSLIQEKTLPLTTQIENAAVTIQTTSLNFWLPPGHRVNVLLGKAIVGGYYITGFIGQYSEAVGDPELYRT